MFRKSLCLIAIVIFASCQQEQDWDAAPDIRAKVESEQKTRTSLSVDESGAGTIYWNPSDQIDVFFGTKKAQYTSQNASDAIAATFKTSDSVSGNDVSSTNIWGLYPSNSSSSCNGSSITTTLPSTQYGVPNTFDKDIFPAVAHSSSTNLQFYNVCGGIKFNLAYDDIKKITFRGNNNEDLAGTVSISFVDNIPKATVVNGVKEITLTPKTGTAFTKGADYYFILLPGTLSAGFTITFTATDGTTGTLNYTDNPVTIKRSIFGKKGNMDVYAAFADERQPNNVIYYTSTDGRIVTPSAMDVFGANIVSNEYVVGRGIITFDGGISSFGSFAFDGCGGLTSVVLPNSISSIGTYAFNNCTSLTSVVIPNSVTSIGNFAFDGCKRLSSIDLPNSVTSIGDYSFALCEGLTSIEIPNSVASIGLDAFVGCTSLASVSVQSGNQYYDSRNNCNAIIEGSTLILGIKNTIIPNSVSCIGYRAFFGCTGLTCILIPNSVTSIEFSAFSGCTSLTSIEIPKSVTNIGDLAFRGCIGLTSIVVDVINPPVLGTFAFDSTNNCPIYVPSGSVEAYQTADGWSEYADRIQAIPSHNNVIYYTSTDGKVVTPNKSDVFGANIISNEYVNGRGVITFDGDVTSIGKDAFNSYSTLNSRLTSIEIPSTVTSIGYAAFYCCGNLTSIVIPDSVSSIGQYAFRYCSALESIEIPNTVSVIDSYVFDGCSSLIAFDIPDSVTSIGMGAFSNTGLSSIEIPSSVTTIDLNPFERCQRLASIIVEPDNAAFDSRNNCNAIIRKDNNALISGCMNTIIPDSVKRIGGWAFLGCTGLTSIEIPSSVSMIIHEAFLHCIGLTSITVYASTPPTLNDDTVFDDTNDCPIYVPAQSVDAYKSAWSEYADRIQAIPDTHEAVDLGLPSGVKWATCNVGASSPEEYGDYFAWGETEAKTGYSWSTYRWCNGSETTLTKYNTMSNYGTVDNKTVLDLSDDAARANWGGSWRMPTYAEWTELRTQCVWTWTTLGGKNGYNVRGPNGNTIFLPAAGIRSGTSLYYAGSGGDYWSSSLYTGNPDYALNVGFVSSNVRRNDSSRDYGQSVRPVSE